MDQSQIRLSRVQRLTLLSLISMPALALLVFILLAPFAVTNKANLLFGCLVFSIFAVPSILIMWFGIKSMQLKQTFVKRPQGVISVDGISAILYGLFYVFIGALFFSMMWSFLIDIFVCSDIQTYACQIIKIPEWIFLNIDKIAPYLPKR